MKPKQPWMKLGARIMAGADRGYIAHREMVTIGAVVYVTYFKVKVDGEKKSRWFNPEQVQQLQGEEAPV